MLHFCTWKDEDGRHYMVTRKNPKSYFNWKGCHLCYPKTTEVTVDIVTSMVEAPREIQGIDYLEVDIKDWDVYADVVHPKLHYLF